MSVRRGIAIFFLTCALIAVGVWMILDPNWPR